MVVLARVCLLTLGVCLVGRAVGTPGPNPWSAALGGLALVAYAVLVELRLRRLIQDERALDRLVRELQRGPA